MADPVVLIEGNDAPTPGEKLLREWGRLIKQTREMRNENGDIRRPGQEPMSQHTLGESLNPTVSQATVSRWEDGKMEPTLTRKIQLAAVLGVPAAQLFPMPLEVAS